MCIRDSYHVTSLGPELNYLRKLSKKLGLMEQVILGERFEAGNFASALSSFDLCLLPSLRDGAGLSIMEAMLAGCVPIVADWCGPAEFVTKECGFKISVTDPSKMALAIAHILCSLDADREVITKMGKASRKRIQSYYNERQFLDSMRTVYNQIKGTSLKRVG